MLTIKKRQEYLKELGFYTGEVDGLQGPLTRAAYKALQDKYFTRAADKDGIYGPDTEALLISAYLVKKHTKNFRLEEFKCGCGNKYCTGYPVALDKQLLIALQRLRDKYGSINITSGVRCKTHNANLSGSSSNSRHKLGKAADFYCKDCATEEGRKKIMDFCRLLDSCRYTYCNIGGNYPNMGRAIHFDVE